MSFLNDAPSGISRQGELLQADFFDNSGGLNISDSPFRTKDSQHIAGYNIDLGLTGAIRKRYGHTKLNSTPDAALKTFAMGVHNTPSGTKTVVRCADTKFQTVNTTTWACTNIADDTVSASSAFFNASSTVPVSLCQFNNGTANVLWCAGAGASALYGYTGTNVTANGTPAPTGSFTLTKTGASGGGWATTGTYFYAVAYRKLGTQAISNAALDLSVAVAATTDKITINWSGLNNNDTTRFDKVYIYRSVVAGVSAFTTGDLVSIQNASSTSFDDLGSFTTTATAVPRAGNASLDNSVLPSGTYTTASQFKRRLVTATGSTLYLSDLNKSESWPTTNSITVPSGGPITAIANIYYSSPATAATDEILAIFKERELWVLTGSSSSDWSLKFVDSVGCVSQPAIVAANTYIAWPDYRGFYIWDGTQKPIYISRPIEEQFGVDGTLTRNLLTECVGAFYRKDGYIIWFVSENILGEQKYQLKLDLRLTLPNIEADATGRILDGCWVQDKTNFPIFAASSLLPTYDEVVLAGDSSGYIYSLYSSGNGDPDNTWNFNYKTAPLEMGQLLTIKRFHKIIVWCKDTAPNNLTLNYWTNYRSLDFLEATQYQPITNSVTNSVWDQATWDQASWDVSASSYSPVVFNLNADQGTDGEALVLEFVQNDYGAPLTIAGFSVIYSQLGVRV